MKLTRWTCAPHRTGQAVLAVLLGFVLLLTGCADESADTLVGNNDVDAALPSTNGSGYEVCETIDFDGFEHGDPVSTANVLGTPLTLTADRYGSDTGANAATGIAPYAFDTELDGSTITDPDLVYTNGECPDCEGLGRLLVVPAPDFAAGGDHRYGGKVTISGFSGSGIYLKSLDVVDTDFSEPDVRIYVDGSLVGTVPPAGNGTVQTFSPSSTPVISNHFAIVRGTEAFDDVTGSGASDNFVMCRKEKLGNEGCTLGYWKNHTGFGPGNQENAWKATGYSPDDKLAYAFKGAKAYSLGEDTMYEALGYKGGGKLKDAARLLLKQGVAALLSAAHPKVKYKLTTRHVRRKVNQALSTRDRKIILTVADELDRYNNAGCPL